MHQEAAAPQDRPTGLTPNSPWRIAKLTVLEGFRLHVRFLDDLEGVVDLSAYVHAPDAGVFAPLQDPSLFGQAYLDGGVVTWPGGLDLAPDAMHSEILRHGEWKVA